MVDETEREREREEEVAAGGVTGKRHSDKSDRTKKAGIGNGTEGKRGGEKDDQCELEYGQEERK